MAGIGFVLERIVERQGIRGVARAVVAGVFIVAGPWLVTSMSLGLVGFLASTRGVDLSAFFAVIVHVFAWSLLSQSGAHFRFTRSSADHLYNKNYTGVAREFRRALARSVAAGAVIGVAISLIGRLSLDLAIATTALVVVTAAGWVAMLLVSLLSDYRSVVGAYVMGAVVLLGGFLVLREYATNVAVAIAVFALGSAATLSVLVAVIDRTLRNRAKLQGSASKKQGLGTHDAVPTKVLRHVAWIGLLQTGILWLDKILFWFAFGETQEGTGLLVYVPYDVPVFYSQLLLIPAMVYFAIRVETRLFRDVRAVLRALRGGTYQQVQRTRAVLAKDLRSEAVAQTGVGLVIVFAVEILAPAYLRIAIASQLYFLMYSRIVGLLYLADYRGAIALLCVVLGVSAIGSIATVLVGDPALVGWSYLVATGIGAVLAERMEQSRVKEIDQILLTRALL